jgi:hypothetical protein
MAQYITRQGATAYFANKLFTSLWGSTSPQNQDISLTQASGIIDCLKFVGEKNASWLVRVQLIGGSDPRNVILTDAQELQIVQAGLTQALEFPRGADTVVPVDIQNACCEIAFALLNGVDPDMDMQQSWIKSQGFSVVRTSYENSYIPEYIQAGIPSPTAWKFLKKYVYDNYDITLKRVT